MSQHAAALQQYEPAPTDASHGTHEQEKSPTVRTLVLESSAKTSQRIADVVVGTAMCMIIGEFTKRQVLISIILALLGAYDS